MRNRLKPVLAILAATPLAACLSFGAKPPPFLMTLTPAQSVAPDTQRSAGPGEAITVYVPGTPAELNTIRVPVRSGGNTVTYLKDAQWVEAPARLFQQLLATTVAARTGKIVLNPRQATIDPGYRIVGDLDHFGLDSDRMEVVVTYDALKQGRGGERIDSRRFEARVPVSGATPTAVTAGLNAAANQVAAQVADWVR
ncbi:ABC-type transport auxiliary lipoprotein family protein [Sphingomonas sp. ID0503]|uniref:ABC-type transport auxiliary lipoprotein family protein n=1 Tax=Sphingomonas sp. ID0503 TaxID=3399691 RepID=UPI003AFA58B4